MQQCSYHDVQACVILKQEEKGVSVPVSSIEQVMTMFYVIRSLRPCASNPSGRFGGLL